MGQENFQKQILMGIQQEMVINMSLKESSDFQKNEPDYTKYLVYKKFNQIFRFQKSLEGERFIH
jgi:hypothetical protein